MKSDRIQSSAKRNPFAALVVAGLAFALAPTLAPAQTPQAVILPVPTYVNNAADLCVTENSDPAALIANANAAGWPPFRLRTGARDWRISERRDGANLLMTLAVASDPFPDAPTPALMFSCKIVVSATDADILRAALTRKFGPNYEDGFFMLDAGAVRDLTPAEMARAEFPGLLRYLEPHQRLVMVSIAAAGPVFSADIDIFEKL